MDYTLTLKVPQGAYEPLVKIAEQTGRSPEEIAREWLLSAIRTAVEDPLENFIGALRSDIPDWADQHDTYLGQALIAETRSTTDEDE
ncbi:MAG: hypothetical protein NZ528_02760 [Caldilineales bacterium]|nr:hypothetical protein [Caldilineales bacterium]